MTIRQRNFGFTLPEALIVIAIISIVITFGVPSYQDVLARNRLKQVVESLKSDLQLARTRSIKQSQNFLVSRTTGNAGAWCYGLSTKAACSCAQATTTAGDYCEIKRVLGSSFEPTDMVSASGNSTFEFRRGTIGANGVTFTTGNYTSRVVFSQVGRVRICTPSGTTGLPVYPGC